MLQRVFSDMKHALHYYTILFHPDGSWYLKLKKGNFLFDYVSGLLIFPCYVSLSNISRPHLLHFCSYLPKLCSLNTFKQQQSLPPVSLSQRCILSLQRSTSLIVPHVPSDTCPGPNASSTYSPMTHLGFDSTLSSESWTKTSSTVYQQLLSRRLKETYCAFSVFPVIFSLSVCLKGLQSLTA